MATVGAVVGKVVTEASRPTTDRPAPTLKIADTSGTAAVMNEPNMNNSSTRAQARPMTSDSVSLVCWPISPAPPPYCTSRPALRAGATALLSSFRYEVVRPAGLSVQDMLEYAMVPFFETAPESGDANGLTALITCGSLATLLVAWFTAVSCCVTVPWEAWNTIWPP